MSLQKVKNIRTGIAERMDRISRPITPDAVAPLIPVIMDLVLDQKNQYQAAAMTDVFRWIVDEVAETTDAPERDALRLLSFSLVAGMFVKASMDAGDRD